MKMLLSLPVSSLFLVPLSISISSCSFAGLGENLASRFEYFATLSREKEEYEKYHEHNSPAANICTRAVQPEKDKKILRG